MRASNPVSELTGEGRKCSWRGGRQERFRHGGPSAFGPLRVPQDDAIVWFYLHETRGHPSCVG
jgi:hypothetical protein